MLKVEIWLQKRNTVFLLYLGRVAQSDSRSTGDQEDRVRSSGPADLSVEKHILLPLIQVGQLSVADGKNGTEYWLTA